jgi:hypothetical protein
MLAVDFFTVGTVFLQQVQIPRPVDVVDLHVPR